MASVGESSSSAQNDKPLIVRVKRKASQTPLDALWLEINDKPAKRAMLDFANLSLSGSSTKGEETISKKVLVQHVDTVRVSQTTVDIVKSVVTKSRETSEYHDKCEERRLAYKKDNKQDQLLFKARQKQEVLAKNARFEQIWRRRMGDKEATHDKNLREMYQFYDIVRVDAEEKSSVEVPKQEEMSLEDQMLLSSYLPLIMEHLPGAAAEIETDIRDYMSQQASTDEYVYDYYAINDEMNIGDEETIPFPLVQVEEEDCYDEADDSSDDESYDSNAENHCRNDYPDESLFDDELFDEEDEDDENVKTSDSDHESEQDESASENMVESENSLKNDFEGAHYYSVKSADDFDYIDNDYDGFDVGNDYGDSDVSNDYGDSDIGDDADDPWD